MIFHCWLDFQPFFLLQTQRITGLLSNNRSLTRVAFTEEAKTIVVKLKCPYLGSNACNGASLDHTKQGTATAETTTDYERGHGATRARRGRNIATYLNAC